jgi:hypothetical protein
METKGPCEPQENEIEELERGNLERLSNLQRLVCELLAKNQCLWMELMAERAMLKAQLCSRSRPS